MYKQVLQEKYCKDIEVHKNREHWTLMNRNDMPEGYKTNMAILSFKRKLYPDGSLKKHTRLDYVLKVDNKPGVKTIGILMHR